MYFLKNSAGEFVRKYLPAVWVANPVVEMLVCVAAGVGAAVWQTVSQEGFRTNFGFLLVLAFTAMAVLFGSNRINYEFDSLKGGRGNSRAAFELDGVIKKPLENYIVKVVWRFFLTLAMLPALWASSEESSARYLLFSFSFVCLSGCRFETVIFFPALVVLSAVPILIVSGGIYFALKGINQVDQLLASILIGITVNVFGFLWRFRGWGPLSKEFWLAAGVSFLHAPIICGYIYFAHIFLIGDADIIAAPYLISLAVIVFFMVPVLLYISDSVSARPGSVVRSIRWGQI